MVKALLIMTLVSLVVAANSPPPNSQPASAPATAPYNRELDILQRLERHERIELTPEEWTQKGRERAEWDYAQGKGEIELYGLILGYPFHVEKETGLYIRLMGCVKRSHENEIKGYNERLRELANEKGPPTNAQGLREKLGKAKAFAKNPPALQWMDIPPFNKTVADQKAWFPVGPCKIRWKYGPLLDHEYRNLELLNGQGTLGDFWGDPNNPPTQVAYWETAGLLVFKRDAGEWLSFYDAPYGRELWTRDAQFQRNVEDILKKLETQPASRPS